MDRSILSEGEGLVDRSARPVRVAVPARAIAHARCCSFCGRAIDAARAGQRAWPEGIMTRFFIVGRATCRRWSTIDDDTGGLPCCRLPTPADRYLYPRYVFLFYIRAWHSSVGPPSGVAAGQGDHLVVLICSIFLMTWWMIGGMVIDVTFLYQIDVDIFCPPDGGDDAHQPRGGHHRSIGWLSGASMPAAAICQFRRFLQRWPVG